MPEANRNNGGRVDPSQRSPIIRKKQEEEKEERRGEAGDVSLLDIRDREEYLNKKLDEYLDSKKNEGAVGDASNESKPNGPSDVENN